MKNTLLSTVACVSDDLSVVGMEVRQTVPCSPPASGKRHGTLILSPQTGCVLAARKIRVPQLGFGSGQLLLANHVQPVYAIFVDATDWVLQ